MRKLSAYFCPLSPLWFWKNEFGFFILVLKSKSLRMLAVREQPGIERERGLWKKATDKPERKEEDYHIILLGFSFNLLLMFHLIVKPSEAGRQVCSLKGSYWNPFPGWVTTWGPVVLRAGCRSHKTALIGKDSCRCLDSPPPKAGSIPKRQAEEALRAHTKSVA